MASLANHVNISITRNTLGVSRPGFGTGLFLSGKTAPFPETTRTYGDILEVAEDFDSDTPEYLAASSYFSQQPCPERFKIGKCIASPTLRYLVETVTLRNLYEYIVNVQGEGFDADEISYTSDAVATLGEVNYNIVTQLNAVASKNYTATYKALVNPDDVFTADNATETFTAAAHGLLTGDGPFQVSNAGGALPAGLTAVTDYWIIKVDANTFKLATTLAFAMAGTNLSISGDGTGTQTISDTASTVRVEDEFLVTANAAGGWFSLEVNHFDLSIKMNHATSNPDDDLTAIRLVDDDWYCLLTAFNSEAYVTEAAEWVEANKKIYVFDTNETESVTAVEGNGDAIDAIHTLEYARTMCAYHPDPSEFFAAAWAGRVLPIDPGSETWKFKNLSGVSAVTMTSTHRTNLTNKSGNSYEECGGVNITVEGTTSDGDFMDVTRGVDWIDSEMTAEVFESLAANDKVPFTDLGIAIVETAVRGVLAKAVTRQIIADTPAFTVSVPKAADVSTGNKALRLLPDVKFSGTLAGAIHKTNINGVVAV